MGGITAGILDFHEVDPSELADTIQPMHVAAGRLLAIHKNTLIDIAGDNRAFEAAEESLGVEPYTLAAYAVVTHNTRLLDDSKQLLASTEQVARRDIPGLRRVRSAAGANLRTWWVPQVFQNRTERSLYERGHTSGGVAELKAECDRVLDELSARIERRTAAARDHIDRQQGFILGMVGVAALWEPIAGLEWSSRSLIWLGVVIVLGGLLGKLYRPLRRE
jgi:hypothetical protein